MKRIFLMFQRSVLILSSFIWGAVSFFWLGYNILTMGNLIEESGTLDYEWEGERIRIFGLIGFVLFFLLGIVPTLFIKNAKASFEVMELKLARPISFLICLNISAIMYVISASS